MSKLPPESRALLARNDEGRIVMREIANLEGIAKRLAAYEKAMEGGARIFGRGPDMTNPANIAFILGAWSNFFPALLATVGAAGVSKFMASPKYITWLTRGAKIGNEALWNKHIQQLVRFADGKDGFTKNMMQGVVDAATFVKANAMSPQSGKPNETHPYQEVFDAAKAKGIDYKKATPEDVMAAAWESNPSDSMGVMLDAMAKSLGIPPPWEKAK